MRCFGHGYCNVLGTETEKDYQNQYSNDLSQAVQPVNVCLNCQLQSEPISRYKPGTGATRLVSARTESRSECTDKPANLGDKTMETEPTIELLHPEEYYEHQQWYQVNYCSVCGIDTGVGGPDCCDFCGEQDDYFYD